MYEILKYEINILKNFQRDIIFTITISDENNVSYSSVTAILFRGL